MSKTAPVYYFGCIERPGHYFWKPNGTKIYDPIGPWGYAVDGKLAPSGKQVQRIAALHHKDGWTALSFWDRSVDERPGSNSAFVTEQTLSFDAMLALAQSFFPQVFARLSGPVTPEGAHP